MSMSPSIYDRNQAVRLQAYSERYKNWSYPAPKVVALDDALLLPQTVQTTDHEFKDLRSSHLPLFNGGVYDTNELIVSEALHAHSLHHVPDHFPSSCSCEQLEGSWLYAGILMRHIGHMLTESIGRLWAFESIRSQIDGVIFIGMNGPTNLKDGETLDQFVRQSTATTLKAGLVQQMLQMFKIDVPLWIVDRPTRAKQLIVPVQLMGLLPGDLIGGHPTYRDSVRANVERFIEPIEKTYPKKIFVSRSRFVKPGAASYFMEDRLDAHFIDAGYTVIRPESLNLKAQLQLYSTATHIVMAAGSAAHVAALAMNGTQNVVILQRDKFKREIFARQLLAMGARSATTISALGGIFWPLQQNEQSKYSSRFNGIFDIDVKRLWLQLSKLGFVTGEPAAEDLEHRSACIIRLCKDLEQEHGCRFELQPIPVS